MTACGHRVRFVGTWREQFFEVPYDGNGVDRFDSEILQLVVQFEFCSINLAVSFDYCKDIVRYVAHQLTLRPLGVSPTSLLPKNAPNPLCRQGAYLAAQFQAQRADNRMSISIILRVPAP
jgi:hypothetical protein